MTLREGSVVSIETIERGSPVDGERVGYCVLGRGLTEWRHNISVYNNIIVLDIIMIIEIKK